MIPPDIAGAAELGSRKHNAVVFKGGYIMKTVVVVISGLPSGENVRETEIQPGTTAGDVLKALNLHGYLLSREGSSQAFAAEENIYDAVSEGEKLRSVPVAEVGSGFFESILEAVGMQSRVRVRRSTGKRPVVRQPSLPASRRLRVTPDRRSLSEVRGWRRTGRKLFGAYRVPRRGSFAGEISLKNIRKPEFYIVNPPKQMLSGPHRACFRPRGGGRYLVHFGKSSPEVDSGIVAIEKMIAEALDSGGK